jgi:hypothetical protein
VVKAVVAAPKVAVVEDLPPLLMAYRANLNVSPPESKKLWTPSRSSFLKEVHIAVVIAMLKIPQIIC